MIRGLIRNQNTMEARKDSIVHVVPAISVEASGPCYSVRRLCESLRQSGLDARIAALDWSPMDRIPEYAALFPLGWGPRRLGRSPALIRWLGAEARARNIGLLHNHGLWMMPNVYPGWVARRFGIPYVVSPRGTLAEWPFKSGSRVKRIFWPFIQRPALSCVTCWHATSHAEYEDIRRKGFTQPVAVIPNGVDVHSRFEKTFQPTRTLLYLGRIHPKKGLDWLIRAWSAVENLFPEWRLRIVGPEELNYVRKLTLLASSLRVRRIQFAGPLYGDDKRRAYEQAEIFVLPTRSENFGLVVAEALACGTPVIVTRNAPWEGVVTHGCGWYIDEGVEPLVACLDQALAFTPERLAEMGMRGRRWVEQNFSWPVIASRMAAVYAWILNRRRKPQDVIDD